MTRVFWRLAVAHTPITEDAAPTSVGRTFLAVRSVLGTWMAMLCTLSPWVLLTPTAVAEGMRWAIWNGRSVPRSKMLPRSTWKPSARCPANTVRPPAIRLTAWAARAE